MLVVVFGLPGAGKSFFACRLAEMIDAEYVSSDQVRFVILEERSYTTGEKQKVYDEMLARSKKLLRQKKKVVLDGTFYMESIRKQAVSLASSMKVPVFFIEIRAGSLLIKNRLGKKRKSSEADYRVYLKVKDLFQPMVEKHLILESGDDNIAVMLSDAENYLFPGSGNG